MSSQPSSNSWSVTDNQITCTCRATTITERSDSRCWHPLHRHHCLQVPFDGKENRTETKKTTKYNSKEACLKMYSKSVPPSPILIGDEHQCERSEGEHCRNQNYGMGLSRVHMKFPLCGHRQSDRFDEEKLSGLNVGVRFPSENISSTISSTSRTEVDSAASYEPRGYGEEDEDGSQYNSSSSDECHTPSCCQNMRMRSQSMGQLSELGRSLSDRCERCCSTTRRVAVLSLPEATNSLCQNSCSLGQTTPKRHSISADCQSTFGWPTPVPIEVDGVPKIVQAVIDTTSIFKYRLHYPHLIQWSRNLMENFLAMQTGYKKTMVVNKLDRGESFIRDAIRKQQKRKRILKVNESGTLTFEEVPDNSVGLDALKNQLWKRPFYQLLNAIDFVYKDHQILNHVTRNGLFDYVSNPPDIPVPRGESGRLRPSSKQDIQNASDTGADPAGHLSERITQLLWRMRIPGLHQTKHKSHWPAIFSISVGFLSDVIVQSKLLRSEFNRRSVVHNRLMYVLHQARQQRSKLKVHFLKQRELKNTLMVKLKMLRHRMTTLTPTPDHPSSIDEGLAQNVASPFVEFDHIERGNQFHEDEEQKSVSTAQDTQTTDEQPEHNEVLNKLEQLRQQRGHLQRTIASLEKVLKEEETRRKRLHNRIQELTGNIRVFCRLRPQDNERTEYSGSSSPLIKSYLRATSDDKLLFCADLLKEQPSCSNSRSMVVGRGLSGNSQPGYATQPKCFIFDRVFSPSATQSDVYGEVDDLIISAMDGYNVCIMAYGQTGSGKTYTMMGTNENPGVNRRAVQSLFDKCQKRKQWSFTIYVSIVEIYQEDIYDLLEDVASGSESRRSSPAPTDNLDQKRSLNLSCSRATSDKPRQYTPWNISTGRPHSSNLAFSSSRSLRRRGSVKILSDNLTGVVLHNLQEHEVCSESEMLDYLDLAEKQRRVGSTKLNICSSRSHLIILLKLHGESELHLTSTHGTLTLADLAGSENVTKSGSTGERFQEAACINKSLSSLGRVFDALRRQQKPTYRETKLTYLLRPNLGGDSKCLLLIALRTEPEHIEETWRAVQFGQAAIQVIPGGVADINRSRTTVNDCTSMQTTVEKQPGPMLFRCVAPKLKQQSRSRTSNPPGFVPQVVYSMGPAITKRGWR